MPYVVFAEDLEGVKDIRTRTAPTLEAAFARIACHCGLSYAFERKDDCWRLVLTDVERPECSPDPITSDYQKPRDAHADLLAQAVDGRVRGHIAISLADFEGQSGQAQRRA